MKLTHIMSNFFLNHMVSETAKTFGKSQLHSPLGNALWQKAARGPYLRHFGTYHRPTLAICREGLLLAVHRSS
jgi:hypothetical protein